MWGEIRRGLMTASNFHRIRTRSNSLRKHPAESASALLRNLCRVNHEYSFIPASLEWGRKNEKKALKCYKKIAEKMHTRFHMFFNGLILSNENFLIGCSPDAECSCKCPKKKKCSGRWLIEIKCPYIHKYSPPKIAAKDNGCSYNYSEKKWVLSKKHKHYSQVQGLMGIMNYEHLDFVVYTTKGVLIVPVPFDQIFYDNLIIDLQYFQVNYLFPYLIKMYL